MTAVFRKSLAALADFAWPRTCAVEACRRPIDRPRRQICSACFATLPFHKPGGACRICGRPVPAKTPHTFVCEECDKHPPPYERTCSALDYKGDVEEMIKNFKYTFDRKAGPMRLDTLYYALVYSVMLTSLVASDFIFLGGCGK